METTTNPEAKMFANFTQIDGDEVYTGETQKPSRKQITGRGPRREPVKPLGDNGPTFHDFRPGDRVRVTASGVTGIIVQRCKNKRDGWIVRWDNPKFGRTEGRVAWSNLEPA